jgi:hypothetical protein
VDVSRDGISDQGKDMLPSFNSAMALFSFRRSNSKALETECSGGHIWKPLTQKCSRASRTRT